MAVVVAETEAVVVLLVEVLVVATPGRAIRTELEVVAEGGSTIVE